MALFGNIYDKLKGAVTGDLGTFLLQGTNGLDRRRAIAEQERLAGVRSQLGSDLDAAYATSQGPRTMMGPSVDDTHMPSQPGPDQTDLIRQALMKAGAGGLNIGQMDNLVPQDAYQIINGGDGAYGVANRRTGAVTTGQLPNPLLDSKRSQMEAQIEAIKAMINQRNSAANLNNVKAKGGGFAPRAPAKGRSSAKALPPLPPGFVVSQ